MTRWTLQPPALSRSALDRGEDLRVPARLSEGWRTALMLALPGHGAVPVRLTDGVGAALAFRPAVDWGPVPPSGAVLIGNLAGIDHWAVLSGAAASADPVPSGGTESMPLRVVGPLLSDDEAAMAATAIALTTWHAAAGFCPRCGRSTAPDLSGHSRTCSNGHQEFPRTDPAIIVLVHDGGDSAVLARQPSWDPGRFSVLAGFAEAAESLESTVAREIGEEVGLAVTDIDYLGSQPWPFPRSLMVAFSARADRSQPLRPRPGEIEEARWFNRAELDLLLRQSSPDVGRGDSVVDRAGPLAGLTLPGPMSISRRMLEAFVAG